MRKISILFVLFLCFGNILYMQRGYGMLSPSIIGETYTRLSKAHLVGRVLSDSDIRKAKRILDVEQFEDWTQKIKPFELDLLFQLGFVLKEIGFIDLAAEMVLFSYANGNKDNFVINAIRDEVITKERIVEVFRRLRF